MRRLECISGHLVPESTCDASGSTIHGDFSATFAAERARSVWPVRGLQLVLDGGEEEIRLREWAFQVVRNTAGLEALDMDQFEKSPMERREQSTRRLMCFSDLLEGKSEAEELALIRAMSCADSGMTIRWFVQRLLWIETIKNQGTPEQIAKWTNGARSYAIVGCFGMTELGSSSYLRGAETTAHYNHSNRTFVINSPTITATKIWIGQSGQIATHCIAFCNTFVGGQECGIQLFIVQIRDQRTGLPMPGVEVGDMGPKIGLDGNDNGFIRFQNVTINADQMLARWASVAIDGTFQQAPLAALAYGSTIAERLISYYYTDRLAIKTAVTWCLLRRQGPPKDGLEPQIMDYPSHYTKLMPILSRMFVSRPHAQWSLAKYRSAVEDLRTGNEASYLSQLAEIHAIACAQKSFGSWQGMSDMETCRRLMGGHAFHSYMGIGRYQADSAVGTTGGGDNNVLVKQTGLYLVKTKNRESVLTQFLFDKETRPPQLVSVEDPEQILAVLSFRARAAVLAARENRHALLLEAAARHWHYRNVLFRCPRDTEPMRIMWILSALDHMLEVFADLCADGTVQPSQLHTLRATHEKYSLLVRENALALVDALGIPDDMVRNPLISRDGQGYQHYIDAMRNNRFNKHRVAPFWKEIIGPRQKPELFE